MQLLILTDSSDLNWLEYIFAEFKRISSAEFEISVKHISDTSNRGASLTIKYTRNNDPDSNWIQNRSSETLASSNHTVDGLFVYDQCKIEDPVSLFKFDILFNSFALLSRKLEFQIDQSGKKIDSYSTRVKGVDEVSYRKPHVNICFQLLKRKIKELNPALQFGQGAPSNVELSHDLDYIVKTWPLRIKQSAFNTFNVLRRINKPSYALETAIDTIKFFLSSSVYWNFEYWMDLERQYQKRSVFYVYSKIRAKNPRTWLMDPAYDVKENKQLQEMLKRMVKDGFEIGLHGSINSFRNEDVLRKERDHLAECISTPVIKSRQHWLKYSESETPPLHEKLFEFDSTVAWNDIMGFRAFCCSRYQPYDHINKKAFNYYITPQIIMDSQLFDYAADKKDDTTAIAKTILNTALQFKNAYVAISWHPRTCHPDYNWQEPYKALISEIH
ncbi:MAG: hypothetical protein HKN22_02600 [Bacteroidia bacterium]|nr:hypothetical protein [Bacteroidia bacterium]